MIDYANMRIPEDTKNKFKVAAALNNQTMISLLDLLVDGVLNGNIKVSELPRPADSDHVIPVVEGLYIQKRDPA